MRFKLRRISSRIRRSTMLRKGSQTVPLMVLAVSFFILTFTGYHLLFNYGTFDHSLAKSVLRLGIPVSGELEHNEGIQFNLRSLIYLLTNYDLQDPISMLKATLPFAPQVVIELRVWEERPFVFIQELSFAPDPVRPPSTSPLGTERFVMEKAAANVLIYHTHTSEMYLGRAVPVAQSAQAHYQFRNSADPTVTGVMAVGRHLSKALNSLGVKTVHETKIHTLPSINQSYSNSEKTVREIIKEQKDFSMVIDLHRDAGVPNPSISINGRDVARLAIIVGTAEQIPLAHPNFKDNLEFAYKIKAVCDEMYPGLMRPVQVQKEARYNQHLHSKSIIIELGSVENTLDEALLTAELLANVLVRVL